MNNVTRSAEEYGAGFAFFAQQRLDPRWVILVGSGYGGFLFSGNESEAEEVRCRKATWEAAVAKKRPASYQDIEIPSACWNHPGFMNRGTYYCECGGCSNVVD